MLAQMDDMAARLDAKYGVMRARRAALGATAVVAPQLLRIPPDDLEVRDRVAHEMLQLRRSGTPRSSRSFGTRRRHNASPRRYRNAFCEELLPCPPADGTLRSEIRTGP